MTSHNLKKKIPRNNEDTLVYKFMTEKIPMILYL